MRILAVSFIVLIASSASAWRFEGEPPPDDVADWARSTAPSTWPPSVAMCANYGFGGEWHVTEDSGRVLVQSYREQSAIPSPIPPESFAQLGESVRGSRIFIKVSDGHLVGFNAGEWGGSVWWFAPDGKEHYEITSTDGMGGNPVAFAKLDGQLVLVSGLAHLGLREGSISHIHQPKGEKWNVARTISLPTAAQAAIRHPQLGVLVVAIDQLLSYDGQKVEKLDDIDLGGLYANSIAIGPAGGIYVGMRYAVARIQSSNSEVQTTWLIPPTCTKLTKIPGTSECKCEP